MASEISLRPHDDIFKKMFGKYLENNAARKYLQHILKIFLLT